MPARDRRIAKIAKENKKLAVSIHSLTSYFPSAPKQRYICIFFHDVRRQKSFSVLLSMLFFFFLLQSDVMNGDMYSFLNVLSGIFVWEMLYIVFYDPML